ncbi:protein lethal(2)essential for life-like [Diachasmimorpha longicaudata]|uniref:protein lethal(2)essential for life-like n=1 Tax=Diachasmimorpha longicaudata TaxID=58733 RepID=UPI0030B8EE38
MRMSLPAMVHSHWWEDLKQPHTLRDQHFADGIHHGALHKVQRHLATPSSYLYHVARRADNPVSHQRNWVVGPAHNAPAVTPNKEFYQASLDVPQFAPEEITVKVSGRSVNVEGKHDDKKDEHGWISRQFCRRYDIPEEFDIDHIQCTFSSDGVLSVIVPAKVEGERSIPIVQTGKPAVALPGSRTDIPKREARSLEAEDLH